ncbi:hypothetical protein BUALT_Bualt16G0006800 [Buddleja alternifolia]|uniref:Pentatricopeptide repeat-containing protein-mitochondrial domain-containing protein n=1 Tax=Buddleja alternifolia TaxID=168488 RepID=A0AAV6W9I4_9LAMI|nr:hypothetical protein BUALT_Bualt16G0006800 [Buddleja alternifolia]
MFQIFSLLQPNKPLIKQFPLILTQILSHPQKNCYSIEASSTNHTRKDFNFSEIAKTVISKCSHINKGENYSNLSLKDYFVKLSNISPEIIRRFWRVSVLKPQDVLELLLGFESNIVTYNVKEVECLWGIFKWANEQNKGFEHFPQSCKIMASMLVEVGLCKEADYLLSRREIQGVLLDCHEVFSDLIEGYVGEFDLDRAVSVYERMRGLRLVPSVSSYHALLKYLVELNETRLMYRVYVDFIETGFGGSAKDKGFHEDVVRLLCMDGRVQEARDLVKKVVDYGVKPSTLIIDAITRGYCEKKDYNDLLSFFAEIRIAPDAIVGKKILYSLCKNFGVDEASVFMQNLEELGFCPDEIALGILIGFSCLEGKLKNTLVYVSEILSRSLKPNVYSYNALLSGIFKEGMWMHSREILVEMNDAGVTPDLSTFRILLAGFCKARKFDEVKAVIHEMEDFNFVKLSSMEDPISRAFVLVGFSPSDVKIRRDNDKGFCKTEFFDNLGNGLYLDTDLDEYDKRLDKVLHDAMMPDFNSIVIEKCHSSDIKGTLLMVDEIEKWGQEMSLLASSSLLNRLSSVKTINRILEVMSKSVYQLDQKTLNLLVRIYSNKGLGLLAKTLFEGMVRRGHEIEYNTYSALLFDICKKGDLRSFQYFYKLAQKSNWSPEGNDSKALFGYICQNKWLNEALELFETILFANPYNILDTFHLLLEELCSRGLTSAGCVLMEEFFNRDALLDHMVYSRLISGFFREKKFKEAFEILDIMLFKNLSPPPDVWVQLITYLCKTEKFEKALELKDICLRDQPSAVLPIQCAFINGLCKSGRVEESTRLFKDVLSKGLFPDVNSFNTLIEGYCGKKNLKRVVELLGFMIRNNVSISVSSYGNMACLVCKDEKFFPALNLKELMLRVTNLPELVLHNIMIFHVSLTRNGFLLDATIDALKNKGLEFDDVTYNFVAHGFLLCNDISRSLHYLRTMIRRDLKPSNRSLREVISWLCHNGELDQALSLSREMESRNWIHSSVVQNIIVQALLNNGQLQEGVEFLNRMELKGLMPENISYDYLIKRFCQHSRVDKAVDLLNVMLRKKILPESTSYDYIIQGLCERRKMDIALDFYTEMLDKELKPSVITWDRIICYLCEEGRVGEAEKLLKSMIGFGETPRRETFNAVISKYRGEKNISKTSEVLKVMQQKGYEPDFDTHWSVISNLSSSSKKDDSNGNSGFLSGLLSGFGFTQKKRDSKTG